jgi:hypothetical protein
VWFSDFYFFIYIFYSASGDAGFEYVHFLFFIFILFF